MTVFTLDREVDWWILELDRLISEIRGDDPDEVRPPSDRGEEQAGLNGPSGSPTSSSRRVHVYCGNYTRWRGFFEEPEECSWEGDVALTDCSEEDALASFLCPGCGAMNMVRDHS